jgi:hypothetical protein
MWEDPIVEEVRRAREEHALKFNYNIDDIIRDLQMKQKEFANKVVSYIDGKYVNVEKSDVPKAIAHC